MKIGRILVAGFLFAGPLVLSTLACDPPSPYASCGGVDQAPSSDVGAWRIEAHNTSCETARAVAHQIHVNAHGQPYVYLGWNCTGAIPTQGLGDDIWCNGPAGGVITWRDV